MGDGVGVPAFSQHGNRHHTPNRLAQAPRLADGVHDFPKQILVSNFLGLETIAGTLDNFAAETLDFIGCHSSKAGVQGVAGFELCTVDEQSARTRQLIPVLIEILKQRQTAILKCRRTVFIFSMKARDVVIHQLGGGRIIADENEARGNLNTTFFPQIVGLFVVSVEGFQRGLEFNG